jgi:hypothetical protein
VPIDNAGNSPASARAITVSAAQTSFSDYVGFDDLDDWYSFSLASDGDLYVDLSGLVADADVYLYDSFGSDVIALSAFGGTSSEHISAFLSAGNYFIRVSRFSGNTTYSLRLAADPAGGSADDAQSLGSLGTSQIAIENHVDSADASDYFSFHLNFAANLDVVLSGLSADAHLFLYGANGTTVLSQSNQFGTVDELLDIDLARGDYFLRVASFQGADTNYALSLLATPHDNAGNTAGNARELGSLSQGEHEYDDFVGATDVNDFYHFSLATAASISVELSGLSADADLALLASNGSSQLALSENSNTAAEHITRLLAAGNYYLRVYSFDLAPTGYQLEVTVDAADSGGTAQTARNVGTLAPGTYVFQETVDILADSQDWYRFTTTGVTNLTAYLADFEPIIHLELYSSADTVGPLRQSFNPATQPIAVDNLAAGTYYLLVWRQSGLETPYELSLELEEVLVSDSGDVPESAYDFGIVDGDVFANSEMVGGSDVMDFYRFELTSSASLELQLTGLSHDADLRLFGGVNGPLIAYSFNGGTNDETIVLDEIGPGVYYIQVLTFDGLVTEYTLTGTAVSHSIDAGNTPGEALNIGDLSGSSFAHDDAFDGGDTADWFHFSLSVASEFELTLSGLSADFDVQLLAADGATVLAISENFDVQDESIEFDVLDAGEYYVFVYPYDGAGDYSLTLEASALAAPPDEAGNSPEDARVAGNISGASVAFSDFVGPTDGADYYYFTLSSAGDLAVELTGLSGDADLLLLAADGDSILAYSLNEGIGDEVIEVADLAAGAYYVLVYPWGDSATTYQLNLAATGDGAADLAGGTPSAARVIGTLDNSVQEFAEALSASDQQDWYRFNTAATTNLVVNLTGSGGDADLTLFAANGVTALAQSATLGSIDESIAFAGLGAGQYYLRLIRTSGAPEYLLSLQAVADAAGNSPATARSVTPTGGAGITLEDSVSAADGDDYYRFLLTQQSELRVQLSGLSADADLMLLGADGATMLAGSFNADDESEQIEFDELAAGEYYLRVFRYAGDTTYSLTIVADAVEAGDSAGNQLAEALDLGALGGLPIAVDEHIGNGDDADWYRFSTGASSNFRLSLTGLSADADVALYTAGGDLIEASAAGGSSPEAIAIDALAAAVYYVQVVPYSGATSYHLSLQAAPAAVVDLAGNTPAAARYAGVLTADAVAFAEQLSSADNDYYRFELSVESVLELDVAASGVFNLQLLAANGTSVLGAVSNDDLEQTLAAGTYYARLFSSAVVHYTLELSATPAAQPDQAGNHSGVAHDLGALPVSAVTRADFVGDADTDDWYRFSVSSFRNLQVSLSGLSDDADIVLYADGGDYLAGSFNSGDDAESIVFNGLAPDTYYLHVYRSGAANTEYQLRITAAAASLVDAAGNTAAAARNVGVLRGEVEFLDYIGGVDGNDYYRFSLDGRSDLEVELGQLRADADLQLLAANGSTVLSSSTNAGTLAESIALDGLSAGTYVVRVFGSQVTGYRLRLQQSLTEFEDAAGDDSSKALVLGTVGDTPVQINEFVGDTDPTDWYRFSTNGRSNFRLTLDQLSADADVVLFSADAEQILAISNNAGTSTDQIAIDGLAAGTYYILVEQYAGNTNYRLSLSAAAAAAIDGAGGTAALARDLGALGSAGVNIQDSIGGGDAADFYRFSLSRGGDLSLALTGLSSNADLQLLAANGSTVLFTSQTAGNANESIQRNDLAAGTYFVRVFSTATSATAYSLNVSAAFDATLDLAGNSESGARLIAAANGSYQDFVGDGDTEDWYRFTLTEQRQVSWTLNGMSADADLVLLEADGDTVIDWSLNGGAAAESIATLLDAGTYFLRVERFDGANTFYTLTGAFAAPAVVDAAGNNTATARDLGVIGSQPHSVEDTARQADPDFYRFTVEQRSNVSIRLTDLSGNADIQLRNAAGQVLQQSAAAGVTDESINAGGLAPGSYFVSVSSTLATPVAYRLVVAAPADLVADGAGNTAQDAHHLGSLGASPLVIGDFVGAIDQDDWYRFHLTEARDISVSLTGLSADADVELLGADGHALGFSLNAGTAAETIRSGNLAAGTYYVHVYQFSGDTNYQLAISGVQALALDAAGNSAAAARDLGGLIAGNPIDVSDFIGAGDIDFYRFQTSALSNLVLRLDGLIEAADIALLNASGEVLSLSANDGTDPEQVTFDGLAAGNYFVRVTGGDAITPYRLRLSAQPGGVADNSLDAPRELGVLGATARVFNDFVGAGDPTDYYRFQTTATSNFRLTLTGLSSDADVLLLDADGNAIAGGANAGTAAEAINFDALAAGTYYVLVYPFAGDTNYTLNLRALALGTADSAGNALASALNIGAVGPAERVFSDFIGAGDGSDYYRFTTAALSDLRVTLDGLAGNMDAELLAADGTQILEETSNAEPGVESLLAENLAPGSYFLRVFNGAAGERDNTAAYRLRISAEAAIDLAGNDPGSAHSLGVIGATAREVRDYVGDGDAHDWFSFSLQDPGNLTLNLDLLSADADVEVLDADGSEVLGGSYRAGTAAEQIAIANLASGDYLVHVVQYAGNTAYRLRLNAAAPVDTAGNTRAQGRRLTLSPVATVASGDVSGRDPDDYYNFSLSARSTVRLNLGDLNGDAKLELFGGNNGSLLLEASNQAGAAAESIVAELNAGTYFVRVSPAALGIDASYTLRASATPTDPPDGAGNSPERARTLDVRAVSATTSDFIGGLDPFDFYRVNLAAVSGLRVLLSEGSDDADVRLVTGAGAEIAASRSGTAAGDEFLEFDRLNTGTYFLRVTPEPDVDRAVFYSLQTRTVRADDFLDNPSTAGRVVPNATTLALGSIDNPGDVDWFAVNLTAGTSYTVRVLGLPSAQGTLADPAIFGVYRADGSLLPNSSNDNATLASLNARVRFTPSTTGTYYVAAAGSNQHTGTYRVSVSTGNQAPEVGATVPAQVAQEGAPFSLTLPWQLLTDPDGESLLVTATQPNGRALPAWLNFDAEARTLYGTAPANSPDVTVRITGRDAAGATASAQFLVRTASGSADDYSANTATTGSVEVGATRRGQIETAGDVDWFAVRLTANTQYTIDLRGVDGAGGTLVDPLLQGLYNSNGQLISNTRNDDSNGRDARVIYTAPSTGVYFVAASAQGSGVGTYSLSLIGAENRAPVVNVPIDDVYAREGAPFSYQFAQNTFVDPDGQTLTYNATLSNGAALPTWLRFNGSTRTFTGTPPANGLDLGIRVSARDSAGLSVSEDFTLRTSNEQSLAEWTIMVYMAADNNLERAAIDDVNEMELAGLPSDVNVVILLDRAPGFDVSNGNWTDTRRGRIVNNADPNVIASNLTSMGEQNTGDPRTLTGFLDWASSTFPAHRYGLVIWDHGGGLSGTSWDESSGSSNLSIAETSQAISGSTVGRLDFIGFDTCLQGMVEQVVDLRNLTDIVIASENLEPGDGWDYTAWLGALAADSDKSAQQVAIDAVQTYQAFYANTFGGDTTTLSAIDTSLVDELTAAINTFVAATGSANATDWQGIRQARSDATVLHGDYSNYRDLGDFMLGINGNNTIAGSIRTAAAAVATALDDAVIAQTNLFPNTYGLTVNLPGTAGGAADPSYRPNNYRFLAETNWNGFLTALNS